MALTQQTPEPTRLASESHVPPAANVHYRCAFDLAALQAGPLTWAALVKTVRGWVKEREAPSVADAMAKRWFFELGEHRTTECRRRLSIKTHRFIGDGTPDEPELWTLRYEHGDSDPATFRTWRTDVCVSSLGQSTYRCAIQVTHALHPEFVGVEPPAPSPSAPGLVTRLLTSKEWQATAGSAILRPFPEFLAVGRGADFVARLGRHDRRCPILLLSLDTLTASPKLDANRLARVLAGTVQVVVTSNLEVDEELRYVLPHSLRCGQGAVRLYQPGVRLNDADADARRHRFVKPADIDLASSGIVEEQFIAAIARRLPVGVGAVAWGLEDIERRERERRFAGLRAQLTASADRDLLELFEHDNLALQGQLREAKQQLEDRRDELDDLQDVIRRLSYERDAARHQATTAQAQAHALTSGRAALTTIEAPPTSVPEIIDWVTALWGDRIVFTDRAKRSAATAAINRDRGELASVWRLVRSLPVHLHPLMTDESLTAGVIADRYRQQSGFDLAWAEGKQTNRDNKLTRLRQLEFDGRTLDITPHVKHENKAKKLWLRVHFAVDHATGVLVVGHCGDHLDTYGTRRLG
ncbi:MAG TPA: hypothetical protein VNZ26_26480 [Vicinamibacterales bacterium]|jgi:hypothetical protein|nr:hypothetical protein [Vicinamibacterales bacterium]